MVLKGIFIGFSRRFGLRNSCIHVTVPGGVVCVVANMPPSVPVDLQLACRREVDLIGVYRYCTSSLFHTILRSFIVFLSLFLNLFFKDFKGNKWN